MIIIIIIIIIDITITITTIFYIKKKSSIKKSKAYLAQGPAQATCARPSCSRKGLAQGTRASHCASNSRKQCSQLGCVLMCTNKKFTDPSAWT